eukprot:Pgem_evm1s12364
MLGINKCSKFPESVVNTFSWETWSSSFLHTSKLPFDNATAAGTLPSFLHALR